MMKSCSRTSGILCPLGAAGTSGIHSAPRPWVLCLLMVFCCWGVFPAHAQSALDLRATVYSTTAAEVFWQRLPFDSNKGLVVAYEIKRNDALLGLFDATSLYQDALLPDTHYRFEVTPLRFSGDRETSWTVSFTTNQAAVNQSVGGRPLGDDGENDGSEGDGPPPPGGARIVNYSSTAAELFWDRVTAAQRVSVDVFRDGELLGNTNGTSWFDDTRAQGRLYSYELVAINAEGQRSVPTRVDDPLSAAGNPAEQARAVIANVVGVARDNAHARLWPLLRAFRSTSAGGLPGGLVLESSQSLFEDTISGTRENYRCEGGGTLVLDRLLSRFGTRRLNFDRCALESGLFDGNVGIANSDLGGYGAGYAGFSAVVSGTTIAIDGTVRVTHFRGGNGRLDELELSSWSVLDDIGETGVGETGVNETGVSETGVSETAVSEFVQRSLFSVSPGSEERITFNTQFRVTAPWTRNGAYTVNTPVSFSDTDGFAGLYSEGQLQIRGPNQLTVIADANTGEAASYKLIAAFDSVSRVNRIDNWRSEIQPPCIVLSSFAASYPECSSD